MKRTPRDFDPNAVALPFARPNDDGSPNEDRGGADGRAVHAYYRAKKWSDTHNINNNKLTILLLLLLLIY